MSLTGTRARNEQLVSDASGLYVVPQLAPGVYTLTAMKQGFASVKQNNIQILVNQSVTIDVKFSVASTAQPSKLLRRRQC